MIRPSVWSRIAGLVPDALMVAGTGAVAYGTWMIYPPAGFIVGGVLTVVGGILAARGS